MSLFFGFFSSLDLEFLTQGCCHKILFYTVEEEPVSNGLISFFCRNGEGNQKIVRCVLEVMECAGVRTLYTLDLKPRAPK